MKTIQRNFRLTPEENEKLKMLCQVRGIPVSQWIRQVLAETDIESELQKHIQYCRAVAKKLSKA